ncbi:hypothetical protein F4678DRAFT_434792 [Xylaria arbuscula]|nr:hypothetical protein F4678DRAFT_434792 [Xylaria arbuscula]
MRLQKLWLAFTILACVMKVCMLILIFNHAVLGDRPPQWVTPSSVSYILTKLISATRSDLLLLESKKIRRQISSSETLKCVFLRI